MQGSNYRMGDMILGFYGGLWAYSGWDVLNYSTGEIAHPKRNVPLALLSGIITVTVVYLTINIAYFVVLDVDTFKSSNAVAAVRFTPSSSQQDVSAVQSSDSWLVCQSDPLPHRSPPCRFPQQQPLLR